MTMYRRLLVTGHLGFIGSAFCNLFSRSYDIYGVDYGGWGSMEENLAVAVQDIHADISDSSRMRTIIDGLEPDAIINFAAETHIDRANDDDLPFWTSNVIGARTLALEAARRQIRLVHVSTDEVYGDASYCQSPLNEESPIAPTNPYAVTKAAAEMLLGVYCRSRRHKLDLVITRGVNTIGPRQHPEKAVPKAVLCFLEDRPFPLFRTPARRMWMHVDDHAAGVEAALTRGRSGQSYNLGPADDMEVSTAAVIERVRSLMGRGHIETVADRDNHDLRYWVTSIKATRELGWEVQRDFDETIRSTVDWYLANIAWLKRANQGLTAR